MMARNKRFGGWLVPTAIVAVLAGVVSSGAMVWSASNAAFSGTTVNPSNSWSAGTVTMTDDDIGVAMFTATGLTPNSSSLVKCIVVTYSGTVTAASTVKLYGAVPGGTGFGTYLNVTIDKGTAGTFANACAGWAGNTNIQAATTVAAFATAHTTFANGLDTGWTPTAGQTQAFRFTISVVDNNLGNGLTCTMPFTWEAQA
jgi:hypothetical protein